MPATVNSTQQLESLVAKLKSDEDFSTLLLESLGKANATAANKLDPALYKALSYWPLNIEAYVDYLVWFLRWIPQQSSDPAWLSPGTAEHQEVYDRLCHFYYLIDQDVGSDGTTIVQNIPWFSEWLVGYADLWGSFLNTSDSFNDEILNSFIDNSPKYRVQDSMIDGKPNQPGGWTTFNEFFARELNPGLRPISSPDTNTIVTSPADCTYKKTYAIAADSTIPKITIKGTHTFASIEDLLQGSEYASSFANGTFVHYFLGPYSYHRFHTPVAGVVKECYPVQGRVYLATNIGDQTMQFQAPDSSKDGYEFSQARGIITIDTAGTTCGNVGIITTIPVGMCQVSSVHMTANVGDSVAKGDEFGYFMFGGSDIIVLFQEGTDPQILATPDSYTLYGTKIATCTQL